ncbi:MAG: dockerin type I domain-containing protein [Planctomycetota bacterium]|nr:dockerin type I domain-containing protein [Planctomycetota bacterium]
MFEALEPRNMLAVLVDVGYHLVEPNTSGQTVSLSVVSTDEDDALVTGFDLRSQIVTAKEGPYFERVQFAGNLWNTFPHIESGGPFPGDRTLALGDVAFSQGFAARANGKLVTLTIDTTGISAGSYEFRLVGTRLGGSSFRQADGSSVSEIITNGTLQVRSIWQNPDNPSDANGDGRISPVDVLLLLNELSKRGSRELGMPSPGAEAKPYFDVDGDGYLSPKDPLGIINCLNGLGCVTTPKPILAQVTPDFVPEVPGSTNVGKPVPDDFPPDEGNPTEPPECLIYDLDEDGNPIPGIHPDFCENSEDIDSPPVPIETDESEEVLPDPDLGSEADSVFEFKSSNNFVSALSSNSVDAVIADLANELGDEDTGGDELVDLGLRDVFDVS